MSAAFLAAAMWLTATNVRSQPPAAAPGNHVPLNYPRGSVLSAEDVKRALEQLRAGDQTLPPGIENLLAERLREKLKDPKLTPEQRRGIERALADPGLLRSLAQMASRHPGGATGKVEGPKGLLNRFPDLGKFEPGQLPDTPLRPRPDEPDIPVQPNRTEPVPPPPAFKPDSPPNLLPPPGAIDPIEPRPFPPAGLGEMGFEPPPFDLPQETPRDRALRAVAAMWENNIGPLEETPAVKRALVELVTNTADLKDSKGNSIWDGLTKETGDGSAFGDFLKDASADGSWNWPDFDMPSFRWGSSRTDIGGDGSSSSSGNSLWPRRGRPSTGGGSPSSGLNLGIPGLEGSWLPVVLLAGVLLAALIYWRFWYLKDPKVETVFDLGGLGAWPIDPRRIATRQDVVIAFEYLSVLICGPSAKMWTHNTIAGALADLAETHAETAAMLARLYELARYAPIDEPLTTAEVAEARRLVCRLAGLDYE
jgi:hypothetical protein